MIPKGRERHKKVVKHKRLVERVWDWKKITNMVCSMDFCVGLRVLIWSWRRGRCPSTPLCIAIGSVLGALPQDLAGALPLNLVGGVSL